MAGAGYKLFNTGDVLTAAQVNTYLMEQTVMRFATTAARDTALSGVLAEGMLCYINADDNVYKYTGSSWVNIDTGSVSPLTTKGDLYTYSTVNTRQGVGSNGDALVADSASTTGLRWQEPKAGNPVLNSSFQIWQRGTSFALSNTEVYGPDRWMIDIGAAMATTTSRQFTSDTTNLPFIQYCVRIGRDSGVSTTGNISLSQSFETINSIPFVGKTVTLSFYGRRGANYSGANNNLTFYLVSGTGTDQNQRTGYTGQATPINTNAALTTTWQRFSATGTVATTANELTVLFGYDTVGTAGAADYFEVTGVQLEVGSVATPFKTYSATLADELAACQRYYFRQTAGAAGQHFANGNNESTTKGVFAMPFATSMRIAPTALEQSGTAGDYSVRHQATSTTASVVPSFEAASTRMGIFSITVASGLTAGNGSFARPVNSSAYLGWSAEL